VSWNQAACFKASWNLKGKVLKIEIEKVNNIDACKKKLT
jgi:hypothetical protein